MTDAGNDKTYAIFDTAANRKTIETLEKSGAKLFKFPMSETEKIELNETETAYFTNLTRFDWLIFADVYAVDYFLETLESNAVDFYDLDDVRVCAFGETVSDRLRFASVHADVIPAKTSAPEVCAALLNYIGEAQIGGLKFLYLGDEASENDLTKVLRTKNAEVVEMPIYRMIAGASSELIKLKTLLKGGAVDEFILTAPTDLIALKNYFKTEIPAAALAEIVISVFDGVMFQAAKEYGWRRVGLIQPDKIVKVA